MDVKDKLLQRLPAIRVLHVNLFSGGTLLCPKKMLYCVSLLWVKFSPPATAYSVLLNNTGPCWKQDIFLAKYFLKVDGMVIYLTDWWEA